MIATVVHIWVKEGQQEAFIKASELNHCSSINEPGNIRFDVLQDANNPLKFSIYEVFENQEAVDFHKTTKHYKYWRDTVADMMAKSRESDKHIVLYPK